MKTRSIVSFIILSFSKEEYRDFKYFMCSRNANVMSEKTLKIVEYIRKNKGIDGLESSAANSQILQTLRNQLELFVDLKVTTTSYESKCLNLLKVAEYMQVKFGYAEAAAYLVEALNLALISKSNVLILLSLDSYNRLYIANQILNNVKMTKLKQHSDFLYFINQAKYEMESNHKHVFFLDKLSNLLSKQVTGDVDSLLHQVIVSEKDNQLKLNQETPPSYVTLICRGLRDKKQFSQLKKTAEHYWKLIANSKSVDIHYKLELLRSAYQGSFRTRDYKSAKKYMGLYRKQTLHLDKSSIQFLFFYFRSEIMHFDWYLYNNQIENARHTINNLWPLYVAENDNSIVYFLLRINRIALCFCDNNLLDALSCYQEVMRNYHNKFLKSEGLGKEMLMYCEAIGAIIYFEIGDKEYAETIARKVIRRYKVKYVQSAEARVKQTMNLLLRLIDNKLDNMEKTIAKIQKNTLFFPGSKEYISMTAWLKSKINNKSYYENLLEESI